MLYFDGRPVTGEEIEAMNRMIVHRGPDSGGIILDGAVGLGNRRLAILDPLTPAAALPMRSADERYALAYNGEIYNHPDLRAPLESAGARFRTSSDAETLIEHLRGGGIQRLADCQGMFAFALWDTQTRTLLLARDRMGEKPLYYYQDAGVLVFASEIKALLAHPTVPRESALDARRLALYLGFGYIPVPETAFRGIAMLPPGCFLRAVEGRVGMERYAVLPRPADAGAPALSDAEQTARLRHLLDDAVKRTLISDVPLGAFLSGGIDSSVVVALMRRHSSAAVKTFSIGFTGDASFDETPYARRAAEVLGTDHTAFIVEPQALDLLPKLVWHHDQPFGDSSAIPTYLVSKLTREHVTVALTGDGGDEVFAGYERFYAAEMIRRLDVIPRPFWRAAAGVLDAMPEGTGYYNPIKRARRFVRGAAQDPALRYFDFVRFFSAEQVAALNAQARAGDADMAGQMFARRFERPPRLPDLLLANMTTYLPDDLLIKTDRSSMAASLEARAPFLLPSVVEAAAALHPQRKLRGGVTKWILRQVARDLLPADLIDRPKHGFGVPLGAWLRSDMSLVRETLLSREARARGLLNLTAVEGLIDEHVSGRRDHGQRLWGLLTLEWWHRLFIDPAHLEPQ
ncbi:MAG: asparagine synthase (glutamine-hydrolyzing) [Anaerolineae bacterium]|nr:asparagine synthase (glutamine-hydrolyzing) [Anaerolineae bacterium]NUQ06253.1 asparagine synthase (glutamine-hydrolyzing) [Anaerolineae bacterium]